MHCFLSLVCATLSLDVRIVLAGHLLPTLLWSPPPSPHSQLGPVWLRATGLDQLCKSSNFVQNFETLNSTDVTNFARLGTAKIYISYSTKFVKRPLAEVGNIFNIFILVLFQSISCTLMESQGSSFLPVFLFLVLAH